jgi:zinc protease
VVQEDPSSDLVVVASVYGSGGTSETPGKEGLAHLIEHLAFRSRFDGFPLWDHLKRMGALDFNAFTSEDVTGYYVAAHKDNLEKMLQLEAWRLGRTLEGVTAEEFAVEREVVRNERRQRHETTINNELFEQVLHALFPKGHPLAGSVGGTHDSLSNLTLEDARAFVKAHYRPENCTIAVSGPVQIEEVRRLLGSWPGELLFGPGGPAGPAVAPRPPFAQRPQRDVPPPAETRLLRHKGSLAQPTLVVAWSLPGAHRQNSGLLQFAAQRVNMALALGLERDLYTDPDIESAGAFPMGFVDASVLAVQAALRPGADPEEARRRILDAVSGAWTGGSERVDTETLRWFSATALLSRIADPVGKAMGLAQHVTETGRTSYFKDGFEELAGVKATDVVDLAAKWLGRRRSVAVYFEPETDALASAGASRAARPANARATHDIGREASQGAGEEYSPARIRQVALPPRLATLPRFRLAGGLEVVVDRRGSAPIAGILVSMSGGDVSARPHGLGALALDFSRSRCVDHGTLDAVGGTVSLGLTTNAAIGTAEGLSGNLANAIAVLADELACREVSAEDFLHVSRILERRGKVFDRQAKRPEFVAGKLFFSALYPDHPYGEVAVDPARLRGISQPDAQAFLRMQLRPEGATAVVHGDVEAAEVKRLMETYFSRWVGGNASAPPAAAPPPPPTERRAFLIDRPGATQAQVRIGCRLLDHEPARLPAYDVLAAVAGELAWSLRERWGATYGVRASIGKHPGGAAHLILDGAIENDQAGPSIARLLGMISELGEGRLDERTFLLKRWDVARSFASRFAVTDQRANAIVQARLFAWPADVWDTYPEALASTDVAALARVAAPCVGKEILSIVGDAASLRPQLEAAGLKPAN